MQRGAARTPLGLGNTSHSPHPPSTATTPKKTPSQLHVSKKPEGKDQQLYYLQQQILHPIPKSTPFTILILTKQNSDLPPPNSCSPPYPTLHPLLPLTHTCCSSSTSQVTPSPPNTRNPSLHTSHPSHSLTPIRPHTHPLQPLLPLTHTWCSSSTSPITISPPNPSPSPFSPTLPSTLSTFTTKLPLSFFPPHAPCYSTNAPLSYSLSPSLTLSDSLPHPSRSPNPTDNFLFTFSPNSNFLPLLSLSTPSSSSTISSSSSCLYNLSSNSLTPSSFSSNLFLHSSLSNSNFLPRSLTLLSSFTLSSSVSTLLLSNLLHPAASCQPVLLPHLICQSFHYSRHRPYVLPSPHSHLLTTLFLSSRLSTPPSLSPLLSPPSRPFPLPLSLTTFPSASSPPTLNNPLLLASISLQPTSLIVHSLPYLLPVPPIPHSGYFLVGCHHLSD